MKVPLRTIDDSQLESELRVRMTGPKGINDRYNLS
jgi:hypothetical protein